MKFIIFRLFDKAWSRPQSAAEIRVLGPGCEPAGRAANTPRSPGQAEAPPGGALVAGR